MFLTGPMLAYVVPAALITMLPGPDTAMVISTALRAGRGAAARAACGVGTGLLVWGAAAALGIAAALRSCSLAYQMFHWACAVYLLGLGVRAMLAARNHATGAHREPKDQPRVAVLGWGYRRALLTCALNPKLGVFFVVFLPHFIPAGAPVAVTSMALAAVQAGEAVLWYLLLGRLASGATRVLARERVHAWLDRITACIFIGFGLRLAAES
jgi:threonine/homoserine/homoserine lactone efflux protein